MVLDGVLQGLIFGPTLFLLSLMIFLMILSVILLSMLIIPLSILSVIRHLICGNNLNWHASELNELESDLQDSGDWGKKWLVDFTAAKTQLVLLM